MIIELAKSMQDQEDFGLRPKAGDRCGDACFTSSSRYRETEQVSIMIYDAFHSKL